MLLALGVDAVRVLRLCLRLRPPLAAENRLLQKQLTLYQARNIKPQRATNAMHLGLGWLGHWFDGRTALAYSHPADLSPLASPGIGLVNSVNVRRFLR